MEHNDLLKDVFGDLMNTQSTEQPPIGDTSAPTNLDPALFGKDTEAQASSGTEVVNNEVQPEASNQSTTETPTGDELSWDSYVEDTGNPNIFFLY